MKPEGGGVPAGASGSGGGGVKSEVEARIGGGRRAKRKIRLERYEVSKGFGISWKNGRGGSGVW
ncbi:unnamed protein product [Prunus armeniaca]|uniref:Uncharacterized protein n=1 Tax=Prunus armeniaca TaxID=36596 RepID=A0A6J5TRP5_PRUAR|nr:unnamed protein product [Prunus armeniaca]